MSSDIPRIFNVHVYVNINEMRKIVRLPIFLGRDVGLCRGRLRGPRLRFPEIPVIRILAPASGEQLAQKRRTGRGARLLTGLRVGAFNIELEGPGEDLFSQVAKEYLIQLNKEMLAIRAEMVKRGLVGK